MIGEILKRYPKKRPDLPDAYKTLYVNEYIANRDGKNVEQGLVQRVESWMHKKVSSVNGGPLLELGAGTLNHLKYEDVPEYDIVEPFEELYKGRKELSRIRRVYRDVSEIDSSKRYKRIISVAVLEHVLDLPALVAKAGSLLEPGGVFQAGVPCEGGLAWGAAWRMVTAPLFYLRTGLDYSVIMRHEHVNSYKEIVNIANNFFSVVTAAFFPLPFFHGAFYAYIEARSPSAACFESAANE